ncbi:DUF6233 domain-containing protein [Streptomyces sp. NPDC050674]|uniref:DUF6233 domain-containing protein n=1 Tax=Streptomyces sp. NPDC050674 TaxID=3157216 RepID=UPI00341C627D
MGTGRPPVPVHAGDCYAAGNRRRTIDRDEDRRLLASGLTACPHCQPDIDLRILDRPHPAGPVQTADGP